MLNSFGLERVFGISQLFVKHDSQEQIILLIAKVCDDFLIAGNVSDMECF